MNRIAKLFTLLLFFGCLNAGEAFASHVYGADLTYECINACTTRVILRSYRDCSGTNIISNNVVWNPTTPGCTPPPAITAWTAQVTTEITPICPSTGTRCTTPGATILGNEEFLWTRDYDICAGSPCTYELVWQNCCRNPSITSIAMPANEAVYIANCTMNTALAACNNSPQYVNRPLLMIKVGDDVDIDLGASDADSDSLVYSLSACYGMNGAQVVYSAGHSPTAPFGPTWTVSLDSSSGLLHVVANPGNQMVGIVCMLTQEYRNGVLIATTQRDMQITAINLPGNDVPSFTSISNLSYGTSAGNDIYLCSAASFCFDIGTTDPNAGQNLKLYWRGNLPGATFTEVGNAAVSDTILGTSATPPAGHFCWTPPGIGDYYLRMRLEDNGCPILGITDQVIKIHVGTYFGASATATPNTCPSVDFVATGCGSGPFTYQWSGAGGLTGSTATLSHSYSTTGTYPWQVIVSNGIVSDTIVDSVVVGAVPSPASLLSGIYFVAPCVGTLYDTILGPAGYSSYVWSNGVTTQNNTVFIGGSYGLVVTDAAGCEFFDQTTLNWASPDIYGTVSTSLGGPLQNQKIYLIEHDTVLQALIAIDSIWTDSMGYYYFCNVTDTNVFLKAAPLMFDYPNELPTYADTTLFWNSAIAFTPLTMAPFRHDFATLAGTNPGGPGFIGGLISQGANKTNGIGDPLPNVLVVLRDRNAGTIVGTRVTDAGGYFSFGNLPLGDYEFAVDVPNVNTSNVPSVTLNSQNPSLDSLDFRLHSTYLELVPTSVAILPTASNFGFLAMPNPFGNRIRLVLDLPELEFVNLQVLDAFGKRVESIQDGMVEMGKHVFTAGEDLAPGIYFVRLQVKGEIQILKIVKMN